MNIATHYLFPPLSIGLALMIVVMEGIYLKTKKKKYKEMAHFWIKIFALSFALGVASGIVSVFAFGNNWAHFSRFVGDVFGSALAAEGIFAFFLEAGFLGLMLFGWNRVGDKINYLSSCLVCAGAHFSAIWIVIANSFMQTPAGYKIVGTGDNAKAIVTNFWEVIFNPSSMIRLGHVIIGCWLTGAFVVMSVAAYYMYKERHREFAKKCMMISLIVGSICVVLQLWSADSSARVVATHQPEKLAAIEGVYETVPNTPMTLIGWVDTKEQKVVGLKVPSLLSFLCFHNFTQPVPGLKKFPKENWPNTAVVFQTYHVMIYAWVLMFIACIIGWILHSRGVMQNQRWFLWFAMLSVLWPYIANQAGWFTAEMGRQPWVVWHLLRTSKGVSRSIHSEQVIGSIVMFICIWLLLVALFVFLLNRKIQQGPRDERDEVYSNPFLSGS